MSFLFFVYLLIHGFLLAWTFRLGDTSSRIWLVRALLFGMIYDNLMLAVSPWFIDAAWYAPANVPRFVLHALILPWLVPYGWSAMRAAGVKLARSRIGWGMCLGWVVVATAWGLWHDVFTLELGQKETLGHLRLSSLSSIPPIATILSNIIMLPMAFAVWRRAGWPWFFLGGLFIFGVNGATGALPWGLFAGNGAEVVFVISLLATERYLSGGAQAQ